MRLLNVAKLKALKLPILSPQAYEKVSAVEMQACLSDELLGLT